MNFYVVTPSFNQLAFLKRCIASVADQATGCNPVGGCSLMVDKESSTTQKPDNLATQHAIRVHHHIQDGGSTDGTVEFLKKCVAKQPSTGNYQLTFASEADEGMYDAINRGWLRAVKELSTPCPMCRRYPETSGPRAPCIGDEVIFAHLNCDEQYLPSALKLVAAFFSKHWKDDVVLADMIVVDKEGQYICHRRSLKPNRMLSCICCVGMTTTTFQRASVVRDRGVLFDTSWRNIGDMVWYNDLHRAGVRFAVYNAPVAVFSDTGENLNLTEEALRERRRYADEYLLGTRMFTRLVSKFYSLRRVLKEFYLNPPREYALYLSDVSAREVHPVKHPTGLWHRKGPARHG